MSKVGKCCKSNNQPTSLKNLHPLKTFVKPDPLQVKKLIGSHLELNDDGLKFGRSAKARFDCFVSNTDARHFFSQSIFLPIGSRPRKKRANIQSHKFKNVNFWHCFKCFKCFKTGLAQTTNQQTSLTRFWAFKK